MLFEQFPVHSRLVVVALEKRSTRQLKQVAVPGVVLREQCEVVIQLGSVVGVTTGVVHSSASARRTFISAFQGHIGLSANHGFDAVLVAPFVEVEDAVHVAVIGDP